MFGALDYASGTLITRQDAVANAVAFAAFLDQLVTRWPTGQLILVLDNASYHKTADLRAWFVEHRDRVSVIWLPTYSPQLNLIERVWRFLKAKLACHRFWQDRDGLAHRVQFLCDAIRATFHAETAPCIRITQDFCRSA